MINLYLLCTTKHNDTSYKNVETSSVSISLTCVCSINVKFVHKHFTYAYGHFNEHEK